MLDLSHLGSAATFNPAVFNAIGTVNSFGQSYYTWIKPRGISMIQILCIGGGGGGTNTAGVASTLTSLGGGGGGSGGITMVTVPAFLLPDTLYVTVGNGGVAQTSQLGQPGIASQVSTDPAGQTNQILATAYGGDGASGSTGAAGGAISVNDCLTGLGQLVSVAGQSGANGGSGVAGSAITWGSLPISGGAGGGGKPANAGTGSAGGAITATNTLMTTLAGGAASGGAGRNGVSFRVPFMSCGGSGGASSAFGSGSGGAGGVGGIGSGGGGGGGSFTGSASNGGNGGPGIVMIWSW